MRNHLPPQSLSESVQPETAQDATGPHFKCPLPPQSLAILGAATLLTLAAALAGAQTPAAQSSQPPASATDQKAKPEHKHPRAIHPLAVAAPVVMAPVTPQAPEKPNWPAFNQAAQAAIIWDSHGLSIDAANSSLQQILKDVSTATGAKVEGLSADQRVFGDYGPGQARDVLSQLLQGSGYNVLMIGDQGQGAPRQILLSARQASSGQTAAAKSSQPGSDDEDSEEPVATPEPGPQNRPGFGPGYQPGANPTPAPVRTPQELMQDLQQHQQQQQQNNPQN
jgi:hypothetical protein